MLMAFCHAPGSLDGHAPDIPPLMSLGRFLALRFGAIALDLVDAL
jgi:hypothetical protein